MECFLPSNRFLPAAVVTVDAQTAKHNAHRATRTYTSTCKIGHVARMSGQRSAPEDKLWEDKQGSCYHPESSPHPSHTWTLVKTSSHNGPLGQNQAPQLSCLSVLMAWGGVWGNIQEAGHVLPLNVP